MEVMYNPGGWGKSRATLLTALLSLTFPALSQTSPCDLNGDGA